MSENRTETPSVAPGAAFEAFLAKGEFRLQCCTRCGKQIFFPRTMCPYCGSSELEWRQTSGNGTVYSTTTVRQRPERGGDYNVSIVELQEGARMLSRVEGLAPGDVRIGMPVKAAIVEAQGSRLIVFRPAGDR